MFERFTDRARRVVVLAQEEARLLGHNYIGTEHLLLGLIQEREGVAARVLESLGIGLGEVRHEVEDLIGRGGDVPSGHIPFTPRAKTVLELSLREAIEMGHNYIGTEHILLAVLREGEGVAAQTLVKLGSDLGAAREVVVAVLDDPDAVLPKPRTEARGVTLGNGPEVHRAVALGRVGPGFAGPRPLPRCSLCGRSEERVARVLVARGVLLCDECVRAAARTLDEAQTAGPEPKRIRLRRSEAGPSDAGAATAAIERGFDAIFGPMQSPIDDALWAVEGGAEHEELIAIMREAAHHAPVVVTDVTVERIRFVDADEAEVSLGFWLSGSVEPTIQPGRAVLEDGTWKVSRETIEHFAQQARMFLPPPR